MMQIQQQKFKPESIKAQRIDILHPQVAQMTKTFSNPVCRQTYDSLPKIYGKKRRAKLFTSPSKQEKEQSVPKITKYFSSNSGNGNSKMRQTGSLDKSADHRNHIPSQCGKKNCSFHIYSQAQKQNRTKFSDSKMRRILLPQIRKFDLQDLQSQHKVSLEGVFNKTGFGPTGLQKIIEQNQKARVKSEVTNKQQIKGVNFSKGNINQLKNKHKFKPKINSTKLQIEQQEQQRPDEGIQFKNKQPNNPLRTQSRYKTEVNDSESPKSSNSISLTSLVFRGSKRQNTNFYQLNKSQISIIKKLSRKPSQLSNGLFRIPEEPQFQQYLDNYNKINQNFDLGKISKKPRFKIQKHQKGVYFGEVDQQQRKHGQGLNVTEKQIFQGKYNRDFKTSGSERNIDGVYTGQFVNGKRQGHGIFKWNNGQIFQGRWQNGMKNGFGIWKSPKGDYYQGNWFQNRQHGQGLFRHRISTYKGQFKNFLKDGYGQQLFANGDKYVGSYKDGRPHGMGRYEWFKGSYYDGQFVNGMRQGKGKWVDQNGTIYEGQFKSDFKHGYGKQLYTSGEKYEGQFREGTRTNGTLYDKNNNFIQINGKLS